MSELYNIKIDDFITYINHPLNVNKSFELIDNYMIEMSSPSLNHQRISLYIARKIGDYLEGKECEVFQDVNVFLCDDSEMCENVFRPDIIIGCDSSKMTSNGYEGTPEFVIEIISKATAQYDYSIKLSKYMKYGVKNYWIVDMYANQILIYLNKNDTIIYRYTFNDKIEIYPGLVIDFNEILKILR